MMSNAVAGSKYILAEVCTLSANLYAIMIANMAVETQLMFVTK